MEETISRVAQTFIARKLEKEAFLANFNHLLHGFDHDSQKKLMLLVRVLNLYSLIRYFKPIHKLGTSKVERLLQTFYHSSIAKLRGGITGLRSLCLLAFYSMDENRALIGLECE